MHWTAYMSLPFQSADLLPLEDLFPVYTGSGNDYKKGEHSIGKTGEARRDGKNYYDLVGHHEFRETNSSETLSHSRKTLSPLCN